MKPYLQIPIRECGESLIPIPSDSFVLTHPHPYVSLGAPYGKSSPYFLRQDVLKRLMQAQQYLHQQQQYWRIQIFDAYRPISVQQFMVDHVYQDLLTRTGLEEGELEEDKRQALLDEVYQLWAIPSLDPATPPPHSTGAAIDVTLVDETGSSIDMGSPIDELSSRSYPDYYALNSLYRTGTDTTSPNLCARFHRHRQLLYTIMCRSGFQRHPKEWWHFSFGDQMWAWLTRTTSSEPDSQKVIARYGCI